MSSVRPGDVLAGKYRVERVLGSGGMGYVVAARHLQLDQLVAMKFLRRGGNALDETEATGRFLREAKAVVRLRDEHVAKVFDVGALETGEPYIVMEYLDGSDLAGAREAARRDPRRRGVDYVLQACEALAEAHALGIVHRDVKLANLFVTRGASGSPLVKVLDFGISKVIRSASRSTTMTRTASMLGCPRYMSPEQMRDPRAVDARTDIWSLGVVLYRLVTGRPPFEADTLGRLLTMVMHENPDPLSAVRGDLPLGFSETVQRCLEKDANHRYSNIAELAYALVPFAVDPVRARGVADRIAATLSVAQMPRSMSISIPIVPHAARSNTSPPGASDTGTAAPWAGTQGGARREGGRSSLVWATAALFAMLLAGGLFAKVRHDRAAEATSAVTTSAAAGAGGTNPANAGADMAPPPIALPPPIRAGVLPAVSATATESDPGGATARPPSTGDQPPRRPPPPAPAPRRPVRPAANGGGTAPSSPPTPVPQSGIPATRD